MPGIHKGPAINVFRMPTPREIKPEEAKYWEDFIKDKKRTNQKITQEDKNAFYYVYDHFVKWSQMSDNSE